MLLSTLIASFSLAFFTSTTAAPAIGGAVAVGLYASGPPPGGAEKVFVWNEATTGGNNCQATYINYWNYTLCGTGEFFAMDRVFRFSPCDQKELKLQNYDWVRGWVDVGVCRDDARVVDCGEIYGMRKMKVCG